MPTNCSAAKQLPQFCKHSKSADLLRKSLLSHAWRVPSSKALSCKHERLFDLLTLASSYKNDRKTEERLWEICDTVRNAGMRWSRQARFCENCGAAVSRVPDGQKNETEKVFTPRRSGETAGRVAGNPPQRRPQGDADATQTGAGNPPQRRPLGDADTTQTGAGNRPQRRPSGGYYAGSAQTSRDEASADGDIRRE